MASSRKGVAGCAPACISHGDDDSDGRGGACEPRIPDWKTPSVEEILQVTSVRLDVEQIPLVSEVGLVGSVEIGLKGA